jgi:hypothetical protein
MFARTFFLLAASLSFGFPDVAFAHKRVALVIGNSAYKAVPKLVNPENDANAIGLLLKTAGFDSVDVRQNLANSDLRKVVRDFSETTKDADIAVVFFAGHGIEIGGINYLIPVDSTLKRDVDVEDEAVSLDRVLSMLESAKKLRLVILDACRDNPFAANMARTMASRSVGRGLAKIETPSSDTLIAYAAKAGSIALDGQGTNSPFTLALLKHLTTPGLDVRLSFGRIRDEVVANTNKQQEPFVYGALGGATVSLAARSHAEPPSAPSPADRADADIGAAGDYERAARVGTKEVWEAFLRKHPRGFYADLARAQLSSINEKSSPTTATPKKSNKTSKGDVKQKTSQGWITPEAVGKQCADLAGQTDGTFVKRAIASTAGNSAQAYWRAVGRRCPNY